MQLEHATRRGGGVPSQAGNAPRCPFAERGVDDPAMRGCPGYAPAPLSFRGVGAGESIGQRETCAHLGTQEGPRGYVNACGCPGGLPPGAVAAAARAPRTRLPAAR